MAIWNRKRIEKSGPALPQGATTQTFTQEELASLAQQMYSTGVFNPLTRNPWLSGIPFGPSNPLFPAAINPVGDDGRPDPRRYEYPVAWNVFVTEQRLVPWKVLRASADQIDIIRRCVEVVKSKIAGMSWDIVFDESASEQVAAQSGGDHVHAMQNARDKYGDEIAEIRKFWQTPDRINGLSFRDWLNMILEEVLVLDALAIYPHPDLKGDLHSLEILDGSTIKPLLDDRGMRPAPPFPAYQQMLYGFPRGEFLATSDDPDQDGTFSADELIYLRRNQRTWTPYGFSSVERSLPLADIYLKRQQWLRSEFTDGVMPDLMFQADENFGGTPELLKAWETVLNDDLSGQLEQRRRARVIPSGLTPIDNTGHSEKFSATLDEYLIKGIAGHFGVLPTEIGYADAGALGGTGQQVGEAENAQLIGTGPLISWLEDQLSDISYKFLGMSRTLRFQFDGGRTVDNVSDAQRRDVELKSGQRTINEARAEMGLPLIDAPEADLPLIVNGGSILAVTPDGVQTLGGSSEPVPTLLEDKPQPESEPLEIPNTPTETDQGNAQQEDQNAELKAFVKWAKKGATDRDFEFATIDTLHASVLNRAAKEQNFTLIKSVSEVILKKV